jgi:hypothetical protein
MGARRLGSLTALGAVWLCALPAVAIAAMHKATGETSQRMPALVWARDDGAVVLVKVKYKGRCRAPGFRSKGVMYYRDTQTKPFGRDGASFSDGGKFETKRRGAKMIFTTAMSGAPSAGGGWEGTFRVQTRWFDRRGRQIDFCQTGLRRWKVGAPAP